jgi:hypothetical protein
MWVKYLHQIGEEAVQCLKVVELQAPQYKANQLFCGCVVCQALHPMLSTWIAAYTVSIWQWVMCAYFLLLSRSLN